MMEISDLAIRGLSIEKTEDSRRDLFCISQTLSIAREVAGKAGKELDAGSEQPGFAGGVPVLEIEPTDQHCVLFA